MQYKSFSDLARDITVAAHQVPVDVDLIVGIPRSGLLAASVLGLALNTRICDLGAFLDNREVTTGSSRRVGHGNFSRAHEAAHALVLDDSVATGASIAQVRKQIAASQYSGKVTLAAVYHAPGTESLVDLSFAEVRLPRLFQWNLLHRREAEQYCVDIDGVLCVDPTEHDNDDGPRYRQFLAATKPLARPTARLGHLVTSRLERYRAETERWLAEQGVVYGTLHMLDVASAAERRRLNAHGRFKASVYASLSETNLFIESERAQAREIADRSGKPVLDFTAQELLQPGLGAPLVSQFARSRGRRVLRGLQRLRGLVSL